MPHAPAPGPLSQARRDEMQRAVRRNDPCEGFVPDDNVQGCRICGCYEPTHLLRDALAELARRDALVQAPEVRALVDRLLNGDQRRCPFDGPDCKVKPDQPCPTCGDVDDLDVPIEDRKPSRCVAANLRLLHAEAADLLASLLEAR